DSLGLCTRDTLVTQSRYVLDDPWRATNNTNASVRECDTSVTWSGWYRLFINGLSAQIPDTCVEKTGCGTDIPLWIRGGHPTVKDGVVTRDVCGHWHNYCCYHGSYPIKVKACPGNYYVYELVRPTYCNFAYCAGNYICMSLFIRLVSSLH
uniref:UMOD/GP2/OIT3-like D8C domain-containing protein n=1 Tax=Sinocyclocheilus anshuiensis TaxID=1608454 RepID=A0A671LXX0_9TELE